MIFRYLCLYMLFSSLYITTIAQPANNDCANAIPISSISTAQTISATFTGATESLDASCETPSNNNRDVWYSFTMPFDGKIKLSGYNAIYRASVFDSCGGTEVACISFTGFLDSVSAGTSFLLRFSTAFTPASGSFIIQAFAPAANDLCVNAITLGDVNLPQSIQLDTRTAYESVDVSCEDSVDDNLDLWYSFLMPFDGKLRVSGVFGFNKTAIFDACGGAELACQQGNGFFQGLDSGEVYLLRYAAINPQANVDNIIVQAFAIPPNDSCAGAIDLGDISVLQSVASDTRGATEGLEVSCEDSIYENLDIWYSFEMPYDGSVQVNGVFGVNKIAVFDACGGMELDCFAGSGFFYGLDSGLVYLLRYSAISPQSNADVFTVQAFLPPPNDACAFPDSIEDIALPQIISLDTREATESLDASCEDPTLDNLDLWYVFDMPFDGKLGVSGVFGVNKIALFDACGGTELDCQVSNGFLYGLDSGMVYLLRYAAIPSHANTDNFTLQAFQAPPNNECAFPDSIGDVSMLQTIFLDSREGTESLDASCEDPSFDNLDLWYEFEMPFDGFLVVNGVFGFNRTAIFDQCGGIELACQSGNGVFSSLDSGTVYLLRYAAISSHANIDDFSIQAFPTLPNDECATPILMSDISMIQTISINLGEASESLDASCEDSTESNLDLWYEFSMPFDGNVEISGVSGFQTSTIYDSCAGTELICLETGNGMVFNLDSAISYLLRCAGVDGQTSPDDFHIVAYPSPANDFCQNTAVLDSLSDFLTIPIDVRGARKENDTLCSLVDIELLDLWYEFTMPNCGRIDIEAHQNLGALLAIYDSCGGTEIICDIEGINRGLDSATSYFFRYAIHPDSLAFDTLKISLSESSPHDKCAFAEPLVVDSLFMSYVGDNRKATASKFPTCDMDSLENPDVWYSFVMPVDGEVIVNVDSTSFILSLYETCGGLELGCSAGTNDMSATLLGGNQYLIRFSSPYPHLGEGRFSIMFIPTVSLDPPFPQTDRLRFAPNPAHDYVQLLGSGAKHIPQVEVYDLLGRKQRELPVNDGQVNVQSLEAGMYLFVVSEEGLGFVQKMVIR